jgi:hypothetical protein
VSPPAANLRRVDRVDGGHGARLPADGVPAEARGLERALLAALENNLYRAGDHLREARRMLGTGQLADFGDSKDLGMVAALCGIGESLHVLATIAVANAAAAEGR